MNRYIGRGPEVCLVQELWFPWELGCATFFIHVCVHQAKSSLNPVVLGFLRRFHYVGMMDT